jgi:hypothetical protein
MDNVQHVCHFERDQVSHPYETTGMPIFIVLYILMFTQVPRHTGWQIPDAAYVA